MRCRGGFALLAVLWLVAALGGVAALTVGAARADIDAALARMERSRARWAAEACLVLATNHLGIPGRQGELALDSIGPEILGGGISCAATAVDPAATADSLLAGGRLNVNTAPESILAVFQVLGPEVAAIVVRLRSLQRRFDSLDDLLGAMPPGIRDSLEAHRPELAVRLTFRTTSLLVSARGWTNAPGEVRIHGLLARVGDRVAILQRRVD